MPDPVRQNSLPVCIACGYDLAALSTRQCPECGYLASDEDVSLDTRRHLYLSLTIGWRWVTPIGIVAVGLLTGWIDLLGALIASLLTALAFGGGWLVSRKHPLLHRRLFRRAWFVSSLYWLAPFLVFQAASPWLLRWLEYDDYAYYSPWGRYRSSWSDPPLLIGVKIAVLALSIPLWYVGWRRASRLAGVPEEMRTRRTFRRGILFAAIPLIPPAIVILLGAVIGAAMWMLDRFMPGWELGR